MPPKTYVALCDVGRGVFAARNIARGERILVFRGRPVAAGDPIHYTPEGANLLQIDSLRYIYPRPRAVFVNHSCNPNAGVRGGVNLVALRDIATGEEIRFDYSTTMDEDLWTMECRCGDARCRAVVRDFKYLPARVRGRYLAMGIVPGFVSRWAPAGPRMRRRRAGSRSAARTVRRFAPVDWSR
jgi:hypothetical protein